MIEMDLIHENVSKYVRLYLKIELDKFELKFNRYAMLANDIKKYDLEKIAEEIYALKMGLSKVLKERSESAVKKDKDFIDTLPQEIVINKPVEEEKVYHIGKVRFGEKVEN